MASEATARTEKAAKEQEQELSARDLSNSRPFDLHKTSSYEAVNFVVNAVFDGIPYDRRPKGENERKAKQCLKTVLVNLFDVNHVDPKRWLGYTRTPEWYSKRPARYNKLDIKGKGLLRIVDGLLELGHIEHEKGFRAQSGYAQGRWSRMRANPGLIELMTQAGIKPHMVERVADEEVIILRAPKKKDQRKAKKKAKRKGDEIDYADTPETKRMRENAKSINSRLQEHWIDIFVSDRELELINEQLRRNKDSFPFEPKRKHLKRIFNNSSFKQGGRFYAGWWQEIPKKWRPYIMIDNRPTCEIDYSGMHLRMLYARAGRAMPEEDPYELPGCPDEVRDFLKVALNTIINADSRRKAISAIKREQDGPVMPPEYPDVESLIDAFTKKHEAIQDSFYSGAGLYLQRIDSQVPERVMLELGKDGIVVLPVHDSFIVEERYEDKLRDAMYAAFEEICKAKTGIKMQRRLIDLPAARMQGGKRSRLEKLNSGDPAHILEFYSYYRRDVEFRRERKERYKKNAST